MRIKRPLPYCSSFFKLLLISFFLLNSIILFAQSYLGLASSKHFTKEDYKAGTQNWKICQGHSGRIYIANNEGVLAYDGVSWQLFPLPNNTIVRFIALDKKGRLYAGGQDEFGYFQPDEKGNFVYTSLINLIAVKHRQFADIWDIAVTDTDVFFRSSSKIFQYKGGRINVYESAKGWNFLGNYQNYIIAQEKGTGLLYFSGGLWKQFVGLQKFSAGFKVTGICTFGNSALISTLQDGLFTLEKNTLKPFLFFSDAGHRQSVTCIEKLSEGQMLIGTYDNGIYHIDSTGRILQQFAKGRGLLSNDVKCIFKDQNDNVWAGLDNGVSFINLSNAIKYIDPALFNGAAGYSVTLFNNKIYFALANGIYSMALNATPDISLYRSVPVKIAEGLSWRVTAVNGRLFAGRDDGLFEIKSDALTPLITKTGYWDVVSISDKPGFQRLVAGSYLGVSIIDETGNSDFHYTDDIKEFSTSSRFLAYDSKSNALWVSHPYRGVYKIEFPQNRIKLFTAANGLPTDLDNHVFKIKNEVLVATKKGVYYYNKARDKFEVSQEYRKIFGDMSIRYLKEDKEGNVWFVHNKELGVLDQNSKKIVYFPEVNGKILSGFEDILPIDSCNVLVSSADGFLHINYIKYKQNAVSPHVYISKVFAQKGGDSLLFGGFGDTIANGSASTLNYRWNSFHFEYTSFSYDEAENMQYSYQLKGFDNKWSEWTKNTYKDYTNLSPGEYTFLVKSRRNINLESSVAAYSFTIASAWYNTILARVFYLLAAFTIISIVWQWRERNLKKQEAQKLKIAKEKFDEAQRKREIAHQLEIEQSEKEMIRLKNEKLESEIEFKNAELAGTAMNLVQKKEFLLKLKDELNKLRHTNAGASGNIDASEINKLIRSLSEQVSSGDEWENFSLLFNKLHRDFLITLKQKFPGLTAHELKLCAYLRMNLSSKEIAHLLSISVRGVEISRYRLRKKLELPPKEDLFQFLLQIEGKDPGAIS